MAKLLKGKKIGAYLNLVAAAFAIVALIGYAFAGKDSYGFVPLVVILLALGVVSALLLSFLHGMIFTVSALLLQWFSLPPALEYF